MAHPAERTWRAALIAVGVLVVAAAVVAGFVLLGDDDDNVETIGSSTTAVTASSSTTSASTTSSAPPTTRGSTTSVAPSTTAGPGELTAVWPAVDSDVRYDDPQKAARGFAEDLVGFTDPLVGEFRQGDSRSGEVEVRAAETGPVTTVLVRQLDDGSWWVLGSETADIQLTRPTAGSTITSPVTLAGSARAFEGTVDVRVVADGEADPVGTGFVTGSGGPELGPFEGRIEFRAPDAADAGALLLTTTGGEDSVIWQATVVRVRFQG